MTQAGKWFDNRAVSLRHRAPPMLKTVTAVAPKPAENAKLFCILNWRFFWNLGQTYGTGFRKTAPNVSAKSENSFDIVQDSGARSGLGHQNHHRDWVKLMSHPDTPSSPRARVRTTKPSRRSTPAIPRWWRLRTPKRRRQKRWRRPRPPRI